MSSYQVCALGKLSVLISTKWMVNRRGPADPVDPGIMKTMKN